MRQLTLDTETTGLLPEKGHRVIEIGVVELSKDRLLIIIFILFVIQREISIKEPLKFMG